MVGRPKGVLDGELTTKIVEFVEIKEASIETGFNRFCDLTRLTGVNLALNEIDAMAIRRCEFNPNFVHVKSSVSCGASSDLGDRGTVPVAFAVPTD